MRHYTKAELELYRNGELSVLGRIACSRHLEQCPDCQKLLIALDEDDKLIAELRTSLQIFNEFSPCAAERTE